MESTIKNSIELSPEKQLEEILKKLLAARS